MRRVNFSAHSPKNQGRKSFIIYKGLKKIGVHKAQISKLEKGRSVMTLPTISRVFRALGVTSASIDLEAMGKVAL